MGAMEPKSTLAAKGFEVDPSSGDLGPITGRKRGVHEEKYPPPGHRAWVLVNSAGLRLQRVEIKKELATAGYIDTLWQWLDDIDPVLPRITLL